jgi:hypothetical protein
MSIQVGLLNNRGNLLILLFFTLITLGLTHPLVFNITHAIPGDWGDPLLNTWILAWDIHKITSNPMGFWDANIFYPHSNTLAYSEHLFASALLALPIMVIAKNPILAYNFVFFLSFILSGFGMYLLVYYLTRNRWAGLIAGTIFAFTPYRFSHLGHLQILTTQWMPYTFLYMHKLFDDTNSKISHYLVCFIFFKYYRAVIMPFTSPYLQVCLSSILWQFRSGLWIRAYG